MRPISCTSCEPRKKTGNSSSYLYALRTKLELLFDKHVIEKLLDVSLTTSIPISFFEIFRDRRPIPKDVASLQELL